MSDSEAERNAGIAVAAMARAEAAEARCARLEEALRDLLQVIAYDDLIPESVSYMRQARAALSDTAQQETGVETTDGQLDAKPRTYINRRAIDMD